MVEEEEEQDEDETPVLRPLVWMGNSRKNIQGFPTEARKLMGDELQLIQFGGMPKDAKPFRGIGVGVFEIALRYATDAYRTVVAVQLWKEDLRAACLPEEVQERRYDAETACRCDQTTLRRSEGAGET
jgi:hypothetical protein